MPEVLQAGHAARQRGGEPRILRPQRMLGPHVRRGRRGRLADQQGHLGLDRAEEMARRLGIAGLRRQRDPSQPGRIAENAQFWLAQRDQICNNKPIVKNEKTELQRISCLMQMTQTRADMYEARTGRISK